MVLRDVQEALDILIGHEDAVAMFLEAALEESGGVADHDDAVAQHDEALVVLLEDHAVVFLEEVVAVGLDVVEIIELFAEVQLASDVIG